MANTSRSNVSMKENTYYESFQANLEALRKKHGAGKNTFSWAEGINRKIARRIARDATRLGRTL